MNNRKILVPLGDKSYEVTLEAGILNNISEELLKIGITKNRKILVISNEEISNLYGEKFLNNLKDNKFLAKTISCNPQNLAYSTPSTRTISPSDAD